MKNFVLHPSRWRYRFNIDRISGLCCLHEDIVHRLMRFMPFARFPLCPSLAPGAIALLVLLLVAAKAPAAPPPGYYLVWAEEFNGTSLDGGKWWAWVGPSRDAVNTPDAVTVGGGYLTLTTYTVNGTDYSAILSSDGQIGRASCREEG